MKEACSRLSENICTNTCLKDHQTHIGNEGDSYESNKIWETLGIVTRPRDAGRYFEPWESTPRTPEEAVNRREYVLISMTRGCFRCGRQQSTYPKDNQQQQVREKTRWRDVTSLGDYEAQIPRLIEWLSYRSVTCVGACALGLLLGQSAPTVIKRTVNIEKKVTLREICSHSQICNKYLKA
ncbi:hypothetical protein Syun_012244 [Stephania yunnanensis]|uniref:Uncharacterized protein n=1 Tax=Stephania yunnanensis TaxID=152371 RepID=A0AAP0JZW4_9MAGN